MDEFNRPKKRFGGSLDGFVQPNTLRGQKPSLPHDVNDSLRIGKVDDFKVVDGFAPNVQAPILNPAMHNKPAEISEIYESHARDKRAQAEAKPKKHKRGFLAFRRKSKEHTKPAKHRGLKIGLKTAGVLTLLVVLTGGGFALKTYLKTRNIFKGTSEGAAALNKEVDPTLLKGEGDGRVNVLLLGKGGPGHTAPDLTDTLLIASIDPIAKETALLSIPRDFWVKSPSGGQSKINAVYANAKSKVLNSYTLKQQTPAVKEQAEAAGVKAIETTISDMLGIPLHYYAMVDFEAFRQAIDAVNGIDVDVKTQLYDPTVAWENGNNPLIAAVGMQHFDGKKALLYARSRHGSARGDFDRTERQREIITALKSKVLSLGTFANPLKINQLLDAFGDHVSTDFSLNEMTRVYDIVKDIPAAKIQSLGLADSPNNFVTTDTVNGQSVVRPRAGLFAYSEIQSFVRNTLRDSFLKSENASIIILNGTTTPGLATLKSTELKSYGYNVTQVADAPTKTYEKTLLIDLSNGTNKYTKNYLEKRLNVTAGNSLPDTNIVSGTADFVIILGSNESASQ
jgi:LCP family protein required for cell wall assembly